MKSAYGTGGAGGSWQLQKFCFQFALSGVNFTAV